MLFNGYYGQGLYGIFAMYQGKGRIGLLFKDAVLIGYSVIESLFYRITGLKN